GVLPEEEDMGDAEGEEQRQQPRRRVETPLDGRGAERIGGAERGEGDRRTGEQAEAPRHLLPKELRVRELGSPVELVREPRLVHVGQKLAEQLSACEPVSMGQEHAEGEERDAEQGGQQRTRAAGAYGRETVVQRQQRREV